MWTPTTALAAALRRRGPAHGWDPPPQGRRRPRVFARALRTIRAEWREMTEGEARARADIIARFDAMVKVAQEGRRILDARPDGAVDDGFGASGYADTAGLPDGALRASLGCGDPVGVADPRPGETVLDLGCGGGLDVLLAARRVGPAGKVYGLDASAEMIELAKANAAEAGAGNVGFLHAAIEDVPLPDASVDVIVSNYVINLSVDKPRVL